jgi:hypothetical protein
LGHINTITRGIIVHFFYYLRDKPTINNLTANFYSDEGEHVIKDANAPLYIVEGAAGNNYYMPDEICN